MGEFLKSRPFQGWAKVEENNLYGCGGGELTWSMGKKEVERF